MTVTALIPAPGETGDGCWANTGHAEAYRVHNADRGDSDADCSEARADNLSRCEVHDKLPCETVEMISED